MVQFDPVAESAKIREHLSAERPIVFLAGAGISAAAKAADGTALVPTIAAMTEQSHAAVSALGTWAETVWSGVCNDTVARYPDRDPTVEDVLSAIRLKLASMSTGDSSLGADRDQLETLESVVTETIVAAASPIAERMPNELPHDSVARWVARSQRSTAIEIYTTNYDVLLETAFERLRLPTYDGFVGAVEPFFWTPSLSHLDSAPGVGWTRIWKVHGSINWKLQRDPDESARIVRQLPAKGAHLILPSIDKYDQSRKLPYIAMLDRLTRALSERDDVLLVVLGFSFGDQHINEILADAIEGNESRLHVVALQHKDPVAGDHLYKLATTNKNLLVYGPTTAIIGGIAGSWILNEPVSDRMASRVDPIFDSDADPGPDDPELTGTFRLGDFRWFAKFLDTISGSRG